jgi:hypothetical protein
MARKSKDSRSPRNRLSQDLLRDLADDYAANGLVAIQEMRQKSPERYIETACKAIASADESEEDGFKQCKDMKEIGAKLLKTVGLDEPSDEQVAAAVQANDDFVNRLEEIAQGASNGRDS